jgi:hypothetical protein
MYMAKNWPNGFKEILEGIKEMRLSGLDNK